MKGFESYQSSENPEDQATLAFIEKMKQGVSDEAISQLESDPAQKERYLEQSEGENNREYRERMRAVADKLWIEQSELEIAAAQKRELRSEFEAKLKESHDREPKKSLTPELRGTVEKWLTEARDAGMEELAEVLEEKLREGTL
jgi:hypothetical protein